MAYQEEDIDFDRLDWKQFEELCYDLLVRFRFHTMAWSQGRADHSRDMKPGARLPTASLPLIPKNGSSNVNGIA
ncbi:hypothetical protein NPE20_06570 [Mucilaginibacter sp. JC4]|uniref:Uncharacterized protein n=1 Tax=Mucilaginibacter aquariorum TaxID=2967225 RepID=A0ABT1SZ33_9SPHI|nr:hypothetical protein [Mucilaginibacter aquariorum]